jgi:glycosyltransferase involved in cell wall biosynthesis
MYKLIFLGTDLKKGRGGISSVLTEYNHLFPKAIFISTTNLEGVFSNLLVFTKGFFKLFYILMSSKNNIIHIHSASYNSFYRKYIFFKLSKLFLSKTIVHIHGGKFHIFYKSANKMGKHLITEVLNNSDGIVCLSESWKKYYLEQFKPKKILVIPNIIAAPKLNKVTSNKEITFLFLGDITYNKGIWFLIEVLKENKKEFEGKAVFYLGGTGETEKLTELIHSHNLENIVKYIGWVEKETKIDYLNKSDVYILPSYNEGLPISILEAMSYNLPIIATKVGGIPEIVDDKNGVLIEPGNKNQLKNAILKALNNFEEFKKYGIESGKRAKKHLPKNVKNELLFLYNLIEND